MFWVDCAEMYVRKVFRSPLSRISRIKWFKMQRSLAGRYTSPDVQGRPRTKGSSDTQEGKRLEEGAVKPESRARLKGVAWAKLLLSYCGSWQDRRLDSTSEYNRPRIPLPVLLRQKPLGIFPRIVPRISLSLCACVRVCLSGNNTIGTWHSIGFRV